MVQDKARCGKPHLAVTSPGSAGRFFIENTGFSLSMVQMVQGAVNWHFGYRRCCGRRKTAAMRICEVLFRVLG